jgi:hypothetical protein
MEECLWCEINLDTVPETYRLSEGITVSVDFCTERCAQLWLADKRAE